MVMVIDQALLQLIRRQVSIQPGVATAEEVISKSFGNSKAPNLVPLCASIPADLLTPSLAYLKISGG